MTAVQFKFMYKAKMHRFAPALNRDDEVLREIKERVAGIVKQPDYKLFWTDSHSNTLLETTDDLLAALEQASRACATSTRAPWIQLAVKQQSETDEPTVESVKPKRVTPLLSETVDVARLIGDLAIKRKAKEHGWLLLQNDGNDCFLNAALQYLRRIRPLGPALDARRDALEEKLFNDKEDGVDVEPDEKAERKEQVLQMLADLLHQCGKESPREFRKALPNVIKDLEEDFLTTQQDAYEILTKILDDVIPEEISKQFSIESARRRRCRDDPECKGCEQVDSGAIHYQHISRRNEVVNLESLLSSEWTVVRGEKELRHCSACCECCTTAAEGHVEDQCEDCKADKRPYIEEQRFLFKGDSNYALVAFNILHTNERVDWALAQNCKLDKMTMMGKDWKAVSIIKHIGSPRNNWSDGHYISYTREDDGKWWLHNDDVEPESLPYGYRIRSGYEYPFLATDMQGVLAILFEKIQ